MEDHPGFATDLLFDRYQGEVTDHDAFWTVRTPGSPDYYFGNYLLLPTPPSDRDKGWLEASFDRLIGWDPRIRHRTFQWPLAAGQNSRVAGFVAAATTVALHRGGWPLPWEPPQTPVDAGWIGAAGADPRWWAVAAVCTALV